MTIRPLTPDVYAAGYEYNESVDVTKIWKNRIATSLTNGTNDAYGLSIFVKKNKNKISILGE